MVPNSQTEFNNILSQHNCVVKFTKRDGSTRTMNCTRKQDTIEKHNLHPKGTGHPTPTDQVIVIDTDIMEWRRFNIDTVLSFEIIE